MGTVLVLDDDVHIAELIRVVLEDAGYRVHVATDVREAPDMAFDCVLADLISLSAYSYDGARDWVLRVADRFPGVPIVLVTAHREAAVDPAALGVKAVIIKPFDVDQITTTVRELTGH